MGLVGIGNLGLEPWYIGQYLHQLPKEELEQMERDLIGQIKSTSIFQSKTRQELKDRLAKLQEVLYTTEGLERRIAQKEMETKVEKIMTPDIEMPEKMGPVMIEVPEEEEMPAPDYGRYMLPVGLGLALVAGYFAVKR